jgi:hypothetical protein
MPVADFRTRFVGLPSPPEPDQNNRGWHGGHWRCRVHGDTELAMIRIGVERMNVRHLDQSEQCKQDQTQQSSRARNIRFPAARSICLELCQSAIPNLKDT